MIKFYQYHNQKLNHHDSYAKLLHDFENLINVGICSEDFRPDGEIFDTRNHYAPIEHIIKKHAGSAYYYASTVIFGRFIEAEPVIMKSAYYAFCYAQNIIKDRWIEAEPYITENDIWRRKYSEFIKGRYWLFDKLYHA